MRSTIVPVLFLLAVVSLLPLRAAEGSSSLPRPEVVPTVIDASPVRQESSGPRLIEGSPEESRRRLSDAVGLFEAAGLALPAVDVRFHDDDSACKGHHGLFSRRSSQWRIDVCSELGFVAVHELAHAWIAANLDADEQQQYLDLRGLVEWTGRDVPWNERGTEDAAFIMQQVLQNRPDNISRTWEERIEAFQFLASQAKD